MPPPREHVDGKVAAFQPIDYNNVYVLGTDANLWLEHSTGEKFGQVPPPREHVDASVMAFHAFTVIDAFVVGQDGLAWLEHAVNGKYGAAPPPRDSIAGGHAVADL